MKKLSLVFAVICVSLLLTASNASAFQLLMDGSPYTGEIQFKYNNWDYGTLYAPGTSFDLGGAGTGATNSYGVFQVTNIQGRTSGGTWKDVWTPTASETLEGWFYGLSDDKVNLSALGQGTIYSIGGTIEMYLGVPDLNVTSGPNAAPPALGSPPTDTWSVSNGSLFLSASFVPGVALTDVTTTYAQQINAAAQPISGHGDAYLDLTGGSHMSLFNTNGYLGGAADMFMGANFVGGLPTAEFGWTATSFDPVLGRTVPEPASMLLVGTGLLFGAGSLRRKKKC